MERNSAEHPRRTRPNRDSRIHVLYDPRISRQQQPRQEIDIVAIHGEGGHWLRSWSSDGVESGYNWLKEALPKEFPSARIVSCEHEGILDNTIEKLLWDLIDDRKLQDRINVPLVIIGHSLGGSLAKQLFLTSSPSHNPRPEAREFHSNIKGYLLFGTFNVGRPSEDIWQLAQFGGVLPTHGVFNTNVVEKTTFLDQIALINDEFESLGGLQLPTVCFYEEKPTRGSFGTKTILVPKETAILPGAETRAINTNHWDLVRFWGSTDSSLTRVIGSLERLIPKVHKWAGVQIGDSLKQPQDPRGVKILCLDGGGVKGLFSIMVIEEIMEAVRQLDRPKDPDEAKPCNYFDIICGTSTGGLLALMLGRLRMDAKSCRVAYHLLSKDIFRKDVLTLPGKKWWDAWRNKPWFSGQRLEAATQDLIDARLSTAESQSLEGQGIQLKNTPLRSPPTINHCLTFVCAFPNSSRQCHRFRTYVSSVSSSSADDCAIWEAARATSAAPLYFPHIKINEIEYFDGGMLSNNPILEGVREASMVYPGHTLHAIVSIGCGRTEPPNIRGGLMGLIHGALQLALDTERLHEQFLLTYPGLRHRYFRLQEDSDLGKIDLAAYKRLEEIAQLARRYIKNEKESTIRRCAKLIAKDRGLQN